LVDFARRMGVVRGEWVAVDGSKFRTVSSATRVRERDAVKRYLEQLDAADEQEEWVIDPAAVAAALAKLREDPEPEARFMRTNDGQRPAYNVQTAVDSEHGLVVAQQVTTEASDNRSLLPMAQAAKAALGNPEQLQVIADAGYSNGEQAEACEAAGIMAHVPANRAVNNQGDGTLFAATEFVYDEPSDSFRCPGQQTLRRRHVQRDRKRVLYQAGAEVCGACPLKAQCTNSRQRSVYRHRHEQALQRMQQRATAAIMRLRRCVVEHPFAALKYHIFGHPRFLLRGVAGAQTEMSLATLVYNLKRLWKVMGGAPLRAALAR
jgi:IS5 family transposase